VVNGAALTEKRIADVLGDLVSRFARLGKMHQLPTQHPLELRRAAKSQRSSLVSNFNHKSKSNKV